MFVVFDVIHWRYDCISDISLCFRIWNDASFASNIAGVIVESGTEIRNKLEGKMLLFFLKTKVDEGIFVVAADAGIVLSLVGFSPDRKFPQAEFSPYQSANYEWNPIVCYEFVV